MFEKCQNREDDEVKQRKIDNLNLQKEVISKLPECAKVRCNTSFSYISCPL